MSFDADDYFSKAFLRNIGLIHEDEQSKLRKSRVAIAGLGGMGGVHLQTLIRIGVGSFHISDIDEFSLVNINRQVGASAETAGMSKLEVMSKMALSINPYLNLKQFDGGIRDENIYEFLADVDVVVDAIDYFCIDTRRLLYRVAREMGKAVMFSAPLGFSATLHVFTAKGISFDDYFDIRDGMTLYEKLAAFAVGLAPSGMHLKYMDTSKVDLVEQSGPSIVSACNIGAGLLATELLVLLLDRRTVQEVPHYVQFDPYLCKYRRGRLVWGNCGPVQRLKRHIFLRRFKEQIDALEDSKM